MNIKNKEDQNQDLNTSRINNKNTSAIKIRNLSKTFGSKIVLNDVNLDINEGESVAIIGASGSGKSVLLKCILGLLLPDKGSSVIIRNDEYGKIDIAARLVNPKFQIGMLFQGSALFDSLTIGENVAFEAITYNKMDKKAARELAKEKLSMVELDQNIIDLYPSEISGGMQRRVGLARAIASKPDFLFFDEPTAGLDPITSKTIDLLLRKLCDEMNITTITITHDIKCMNIIADKVAVIAEKTIVWYDKLSDIKYSDHPYVKEFITI